jgi:molybdopterin converting factor small subunit
MKITVKLFATLRDFGPEIEEKSVPENSNVVHTDPKEMLKEGDVLALFPPVGGG